MTSPVIFTVPNSNFIIVPDTSIDGRPTTNQIIVTCPDGTKITIPAGYMYNNNSSTNNQSVFTGRDNTQIIFEFPIGTIYNQGQGQYSSIFVTPNNITYSFINTPPIILGGDNSPTTVKTYSGTIDITNIQNNIISDVSHNTVGAINDCVSQNKTQSEDGPVNIEKKISDTFNNTIITFVCALLKDIFVVFFAWIIIINIGLWVKEEPQYIHPIDVSKYPYTFTNSELSNDLSSFNPRDDGFFCGKLKDTVNTTKDLKKFLDSSSNTEIKDKLYWINPAMYNVDEKNVYFLSKLIQDKCSKTRSYSDALSIFLYWLAYLCFNQQLYNSYILYYIHLLLHKIIKIFNGSYEYRIYNLFLVFFIPIFITAGEPTVNAIKKLFNVGMMYDFIDDYNPSKLVSNSIIYIFIYILSFILLITIPTFFILFSIGLIGHIFSIGRIIFESNSVECVILSMIALIATIVTLFKLMINFVSRKNSTISIDGLLEQFTNNLNINGGLNIIGYGAGVGIPLGIALCSAIIISFRIVNTTFYLFKTKGNLLYSTRYGPLVLIIGFFLANIFSIIGYTEFLITSVVFFVLFILFFITFRNRKN
jgi:hypothetical protein